MDVGSIFVSVAGCCILVLDAATCGCRCCVAQARLDESRHGEQSVRCRIGQPSRAVDRLQPSLPRRLFLFATRPLLRLALFFSGFHWVRAPPAPPREHASPSAPTPRGPSQVRGRDMPGYSYDAQACVVANQGGLLELLYLLWLIAYLTAYPLIARIRQVAEHANVPGLFNSDPRLNTRTTLARWFERPFLCPNGVNYHVEHHLLASVPCYKLKALHQHLRKKGFYDGYEHTLAQGYWDVIRRAVPDFDSRQPSAA